METIFGLSIIFLAIYLLFIKGFLWKLIIAIFGWIGLHAFLESSFFSSKSTFMTILGCTVSWSVFIPSIVIMLCMATTKVKENV